MSQAVVRGGHDTFVNSARPSLEYDGAKYLRLKTAAEHAYIYFRNPAPRGATITSATIRVYARGASSGSRVLTVSRVAQAWKVRQLNWDNQPTIKTDGVTKSIATLADGDAIDIDVTTHLQTMCNGAANFGWKISTSAATEHLIYGFDSGDLKPSLRVVWSDAPDEPTSLSPSGGVIATAKPTLQFDYTDVSGNTELAAVRVQVDAAKNATDPAFDTGPVAATEPELALNNGATFVRTLSVTKTASSTSLTGGSFAKADIGATITGTGIPAGATITAVGTTVYDATSDEYRATTATLSAAATTSGTITATITRAYAGIAEDATTYWRVKVQDGGGLWSGWSSWASMKRDSLPTLTITNPPSGTPTVADVTPPILWTFSGQTAYRVFITLASDPTKIVHDSGKRTGSAQAYTVPKDVLKKNQTYTVIVRAWDAITTREKVPGVPIYAEASRDFTVTTGATTVVTSTAAAQYGITPWIDVTWSRSSAPDSFTILRDGDVIDSLVLPGDVLVSGTSYKYRDYTADPNVSHTYNVRAVVNGVQSGNGPTSASVTASPEGIWLVDLDRGINVTLYGNDTGTWELEDSANTYQPVGSAEIVRVVTGMSGLRGSLSGVLTDGFGKTFAAMEADLYAIKERPTQTVRLIVGDMNIRVILGDIKVSPMPYTRNGQRFKDVSFSFWQKGDLPFTPRI